MNFIWSFPSIKVSNVGDLQEVIIIVDWVLTLEDDKLSSFSQGTIALEKPSADDFIPLNQINKEKMQVWVENAIGIDAVERIKNGLKKQIEKKNKSVKINTLYIDWK